MNSLRLNLSQLIHDQRIVVCGATGNTGSEIIKNFTTLNRQGSSISFVALTSQEVKKVSFLRRGIPAIVGDYDECNSLKAAFAGAHSVFIALTPDSSMDDKMKNIVEAAMAVGVKRIVYASALWAERVPSATPILELHHRNELILKESSIPEVFILRPGLFIQTTLFPFEQVLKSGALLFSGGEEKIAIIDYRTSADVATWCLLQSGSAIEDRKKVRAFNLTGPKALSFKEMAQILTRVFAEERPSEARTIEYVQVPIKRLMQMMNLIGVRDQTTLDHCRLIGEHIIKGDFKETSEDLQSLPILPISFEQTVRDLIRNETSGGNSFTPPNTLKIKVMSFLMPYVMRFLVASGLTKLVINGSSRRKI